MATNPMQRKTRNAFILGMVLALLIGAVAVALSYMKIKSLNDEINTYKTSVSTVYVLSQDVQSGQVLTPSMFIPKSVPISTIPSNSTADIATTINSYSLSTTDGKPVYIGINEQNIKYYYVDIGVKKQDGTVQEFPLYITDKNGQQQLASILTMQDKAYYTDQNKNKVNVTIASNAVIAKVALKANTVLSTSLITRASEVVTNDLRKQEYNVIALPINLVTGDYVDIRLMLPNGQDYVVLSKKQVTVPVVNGAYLVDTIQMRLKEDEILNMNSAIIDNYRLAGSKLYATRYDEPGVQNVATVTYYPLSDVTKMLENGRDPNADELVKLAIYSIRERRQEIRDDIEKNSNYKSDTDVSKDVETSITTQLEARQQYLQSLPVTTTY